MIFSGDIALPGSDAIILSRVPEALAQQKWMVNLEGSLLSISNEKERESLLNKHIVFNDLEAIRSLTQQLNIGAFNLANNHLLDAAPFSVTASHLNALSVPYWGAGSNSQEAARELLISEGEDHYALLSFGWDAINCIYAGEKQEGVNPYTREHVWESVKALLQKEPERKVVCLFHWNYELEAYPQPLDRELAHRLIDLGVWAVIGCHAHRVQPIEIYRGRPIVYGMGNFMFRHAQYMQGRIAFPPLTYPELAVELRGDSVFFHRFEYSPQEHTLHYRGLMDLSEWSLPASAVADYSKFFKQHRVQRKALPIFYYEDSPKLYRAKVAWVKKRNQWVASLSGNPKITRAIKAVLTKLFH